MFSGRVAALEKVQENDHDIVDLAQQTAEGAGAALTQHIHAQADSHSQKDGRNQLLSQKHKCQTCCQTADQQNRDIIFIVLLQTV